MNLLLTLLPNLFITGISAFTLTLKLSLFALLETDSRKLFPKLTILVLREALTERNSRSVITSTLTLLEADPRL